MKLSIRQICYIAIMTAIMAALSVLNIPTPWGVPFTLQTFIVALCGFLLGKWRGPISVILYIMLGAIGLPIFTGMNAGVGVLAGPTGGYLWGFIFMAFFCGLGLIFIKKKAGFLLTGLFGILGLAICHLFGILWFMHVTNMTFLAAAMLASFPYLIKDLISVCGALAIAVILKKALNRANILI